MKEKDADCPHCRFPKKYEQGFPSEDEFVKMKSLLVSDVEKGNLCDLGRDESEEKYFWHEIYECARCGSRWKLSEPDQAYRGGLRKISKGEFHPLAPPRKGR